MMKYLLPTEVFLQLIDQELAQPAQGKGCRKNYLDEAKARDASRKRGPLYKIMGAKRPFQRRDP